MTFPANLIFERKGDRMEKTKRAEEAVVEEILSWAGDGEDDMAFKYNIIRAFEDERAEGKDEGKEEGKNLKLIGQVRKKLSKNIPLEETADMLEEETAAIAPIYDLLKSHPDWEDERICAGLVKPESQAPERGTDVSL